MKYLTFLSIFLVFLVSSSLPGQSANTSSSMTLTQQLTKPQIAKKIGILRKRIVESSLSNRDKNIMLEAFDHVARTQYGNWLLSKVEQELIFSIGSPEIECTGFYTPQTKTICLNSTLFTELSSATNTEQARLLQFRIAGTLAHEMTHSIQFSNKLLDTKDCSFSEKITIHRLMELNAMLSQTFVLYQMEFLPEYIQIMNRPGIILLDAKEGFIRELVEAQKAMGANQMQAEKFARTKFVEAFWLNASNPRYVIGNRVITPNSEMIKDWNDTYNMDAFRFFCLDSQDALFSAEDKGIKQQLTSFAFLMGIALHPSFFQNPRAASFKLPFRQRLISYYEGKISMVIDALSDGYVSKSFHNGRLIQIEIKTNFPNELNKSVQEKYSENNIIRAEYTVKNGKINGLYKEFNHQGEQLLEVPVKDNLVQGEGWMLEDTRKSMKIFQHGKVLN